MDFDMGSLLQKLFTPSRQHQNALSIYNSFQGQSADRKTKPEFGTNVIRFSCGSLIILVSL